MYRPRQNVRTPLDYDTQFESELPPEIRRELETSQYPINRWPARIPETEEEIEQALAWLKAQGFLQEPTPPAPPPQVLIRPAPVSPPAKPAENASRRGAGIWLLLAMLIGLPLLLTRLADNTPPQSRPVEVRRALPAVESPQSVATGSARFPRHLSGGFECGVAADKDARRLDCAGFLPR